MFLPPCQGYLSAPALFLKINVRPEISVYMHGFSSNCGRWCHKSDHMNYVDLVIILAFLV